MAIAATKIIDEIILRMKQITTANEYNITVKKVVRGRLEPFKGYDLPAVNVWSADMNNEQLAYGQEKRTLSVMIEIHDSTRDEPFTTVVERISADVVTAIARKTTAPKVSNDLDCFLNDTVQDVIFDGFTYEIGKGQTPFCGALCRFRIIYNTDKFNMSDYS